LRRAQHSINRISDDNQEATVKNPLDSLWGTVISGLVLTAILYFIARALVSSAMGTGA
jgi:hypothetical protein